MNNLKITLLVLVLGFASCKRNGGHDGLSTDIVNNGKTAKITFDNVHHDFGVITDETPVMYDFFFTNTGDNDLIISDVHASCACTVPNWPKDPIKPGGKGDIKVRFEPAGKSGMVTKVVTIEANTNPKITKVDITADIHPVPENN